MNIGILTHCVANNFGANLQALSTGNWLKRHGFVPVYLQWNAYLESEKKGMNTEQSQYHQLFLVKQGYIVARPCSTNQDFIDVIRDYKIENIIVGSDCVLTYRRNLIPYGISRHGIVKLTIPEDYKFPNPFWLPFINGDDGINCYMISASSGSSNYCNIRGGVKKEMKRLLAKFKYIAVRDTNAQKMINYIFDGNKNVNITPDPVFGFADELLNLPTKEEICNRYHLPQDYLAISFYERNWPSQKWFDEFRIVAHRHGLKCIGIPMPSGGKRPQLDINIDLPLDPLDWYCILKYSRGYIGNNMHPVVISLHNAVPFFSFNGHGRFLFHKRIQLIRYSKEYDILKRFGLLQFEVAQKRSRRIKPQYVIDRILDFNLEERMEISKLLKVQYEDMMMEVKDRIEKS
ncbi:MAG: polysaccharide pyruvyl transferase family protein [Prevotella sp.]|nr:polysaccharide pyruvyl transferase family protein [Prevotella sp.]